MEESESEVPDSDASGKSTSKKTSSLKTVSKASPKTSMKNDPRTSKSKLNNEEKTANEVEGRKMWFWWCSFSVSCLDGSVSDNLRII
jgi:hypothetical protein